LTEKFGIEEEEQISGSSRVHADQRAELQSQYLSKSKHHELSV